MANKYILRLAGKQGAVIRSEGDSYFSSMLRTQRELKRKEIFIYTIFWGGETKN